MLGLAPYALYLETIPGMDAWQASTHDSQATSASSEGSLVLDWQACDEPMLLDPQRSLVIGSDPDADIRLQVEGVSRFHSRISWQGAHFMLWDSSTNGSFVRSEDEHVRFIRRNGVRLWGAGSISFCGPEFAESVLNFSHTTG